MKNIYKIFAFLMLIAIKINVKSANYIYQEINGTLTSVKQINFSMFIKNLTGVVLYAVDHSDRILIELIKEDRETDIVFTFNHNSVKRNLRSICGCWDCSYIYMEMLIEQANMKLSVTCDVIRTLMAIESKEKIIINKIFAFPFPKNYDKIKNKTFIMIGNIGPFIGNTDISYHPLENQLVGCLYKLYINGKQILFNSSGSLFNSTCPTEYMVTICKLNECTQSTVTYEINDCSISQLNRRYCVSDLSPSFEKQLQYLNGNLQVARVDWLLDHSKVSSCLIELEMKNEYFIVFRVIYPRLYMEIVSNNGSSYEELKLVSSNSIETMVLNFIGKNVIIQLSSGDDIKTYIQPIASEPISIQVGSLFKTKNCKAFQGRMNFKDQMKQITVSNSTIKSLTSSPWTTTIPNSSKMTFAITFSITIFVLLISIFLVLLFCIITKGKTLSQSRKIILRASEIVTQSQLEASLKPQINDYELEGQQVYISTRDSDGYEVFPENK